MEGRLVTGQGAGAGFVAATEDTLAAAIGFRPYAGTVNLDAVGELEALPRRVIDDDLGDPHCDGVHLRPCRVGGILASVIRPLVPGYPDEKVELLAPVELRALFGLDDGDAIPISPPDESWSPDGPPAKPSALEAFDAVVFDLDGTLVDLAVDWSAVHDDIESTFGRFLDQPVRDHTQNELFSVAANHGVADDLAELIASYERDGADDAIPLAGVEALGDWSVPIGICTANAADAADRSLAQFDVHEVVDAIVARETVRPGKPAPEPLLECLERLDRDPGNALFVGNERGDAATAIAANTSFFHVDQLWPED